ncbi:hypothetical protein LWI28_002122 [Acer negundo]|uniref:Uncharacterized protein n=1 Tax=Acer negundo TaxID=4023 RepID=A0AAD5P0V2_ACENE|nr:hypothetical protein LWI28_002122 [Acer negundo]
MWAKHFLVDSSFVRRQKKFGSKLQVSARKRVSPSMKLEAGADDCSFFEVLDPGVDGTSKDEDLADWDWGDQIEEIEDGSKLAEEEIKDLQVSMVSVDKDPPPKLELKELPTTLKVSLILLNSQPYDLQDFCSSDH